MNMTNVSLVVDQEFGKVYEDLFGLTIEDCQVTEEAEVEHNYPRLRPSYIGKALNRSGTLLHIKWGKVQGKPTLRLTITKVKSRGEDDKVLLRSDITAEPDENGNFRHPRQYVFQALKEVKRQFSAKVGCSICGKPDIWFKKIPTPQFPLYQVMWKELDEKLVNRRQAEFNPVPELDDDGNEYDSIFADSVSEPYTVRRDLQFDNIDYLAALDVHTSNLQLGG
jgi:hypothetical protein